MSAKDILEAGLGKTKLANTSVLKTGLIKKDVAFEIAVTNNGMYSGRTTLTLVKGNPLDVKSSFFDNKNEALKEVERLKSEATSIQPIFSLEEAADSLDESNITVSAKIG